MVLHTSNSIFGFLCSASCLFGCCLLFVVDLFSVLFVWFVVLLVFLLLLICSLSCTFSCCVCFAVVVDLFMSYLAAMLLFLLFLICSVS